MNEKSARLLARQARGFVDRDAAEILAIRGMLQTIRDVYELYGFEAVETPIVEYTDALGKFLPDQDRPNEGVFSFRDDDEQWLSLRYDLTAPLARYVAENFERLPKPYRSYRAGHVFRNEKPGPGRFRQFMQFDADTVGSASPAADAEMCMMAADAMERLGIPRGAYTVKVSNRKILDGVMEAIGLSGKAHAGTRLTVLRAIDKLDRLGAAAVRDLLGPGRRDESGDFTKGAGLSEAQIETIALLIIHHPMPMETTPANSNRQTLQNYRAAMPDHFLVREGLAELEQIANLTQAAGYGGDQIQIDASVVRGLEYYTGPVYEVDLTLQGEDGARSRLGSVGGGGRYDGLVSRFRGEAVPATGFSIGVSRLLAALTALGRIDMQPEPGPVIVCVMDQERFADYQAMAAELRRAGVRAEVYLGGSGMKAQLKYADRRKSPVAIIQGSDEAARGEVQIKDLVLGAQMAKAIASNTEWREARVAQTNVPREDLVKAVKAILRAGVAPSET